MVKLKKLLEFQKLMILQPKLSDQDFKSTNVKAVGKDDSSVAYNFYVSHIRYRKEFSEAQPINIEFNFDGVVPAVVNEYAISLTNIMISNSSDGQRQWDLI